MFCTVLKHHFNAIGNTFHLYFIIDINTNRIKCYIIYQINCTMHIVDTELKQWIHLWNWLVYLGVFLSLTLFSSSSFVNLIEHRRVRRRFVVGSVVSHYVIGQQFIRITQCICVCIYISVLPDSWAMFFDFETFGLSICKCVCMHNISTV